MNVYHHVDFLENLIKRFESLKNIDAGLNDVQFTPFSEEKFPQKKILHFNLKNWKKNNMAILKRQCYGWTDS